MNGNSWILWVIAGGLALYWILHAKAASAANLDQTAAPTGSTVSGGAVYNAPATSNPLTGTSAAPAPPPRTAAVVATYLPSPGLPPGTTVVNGWLYDQATGDWLGEAPGAGGDHSYTPQHLLVN